MALYHSPKIVRDGLIFAIEASDPASYPGEGTTWYNVAASSPNATLPSEGLYTEGTIEFSNGRADIGNLQTGIWETTMEVWFYVPSGGSYTGCCETLFGTYWFRTFIIGQSVYTMIGFANQDGSYNTYQHPAFSVTYDEWHHTLGMRRGDRYIIWQDGVEVYNGSFGAGLRLYGAVGGWVIADPDHPRIRIGSARVYNRGLTDDEIRQNYDAHKMKFRG